MMSNNFDLYEVKDTSKNVLISLGSLLTFYAIETLFLTVWSTPFIATLMLILALLSLIELGAFFYHWTVFSEQIHLKQTKRQKLFSYIGIGFSVLTWCCACAIPFGILETMPRDILVIGGDLLWGCLLVSAGFGAFSYNNNDLKAYIDQSL